MTDNERLYPTDDEKKRAGQILKEIIFFWSLKLMKSISVFYLMKNLFQKWIFLLLASKIVSDFPSVTIKLCKD